MAIYDVGTCYLTGAFDPDDPYKRARLIVLDNGGFVVRQLLDYAECERVREQLAAEQAALQPPPIPRP